MAPKRASNLLSICFRDAALLAVIIVCSLFVASQRTPPPSTKHFSAPAQRFQSKLDFLERNGKANPVQRRSTQINADEVNAWFREGGYKLPQGVQKVVQIVTVLGIQVGVQQ